MDLANDAAAIAPTITDELHAMLVTCFKRTRSAPNAAFASNGAERSLALVARTRDTLAKINAASVNTAKGVFQHPATQLAALKAARENIEKAIEIMQARYKD